MDRKEVKEGTMDTKATMEIYRKLGTPGAPHSTLAGLTGSWTTKTKTWMEPDKPPIESTGTCEQRMLLDGRYLQQEYAGDMMGSTYAGINIVGYDNHTKKYQSIWIDSMSTGIYFFEGTGSADGKTMTQQNSYDDPVRGPMEWRIITRIVDNDRVEIEMFFIPKGGREEKMMEITLSRKK